MERRSRTLTLIRGIGPRTRLTMLALGALSAFLVLALSGSLSAHTVENWFDDFGWAGPIVFIVV